MMHATAPAVVPRWEWRTFAVLDVDPLLAPTRSAEPVESDESYILSEYAEASVKIRGGVLDVKVLTRVDGAGLQQWVPTMKATFPLDRQAWEVTFAAL
ncbi:MAG TPA: hypothetical protein VH228_11740, partial [Nocardioides sp.]|nr:hypothetical protein [Nocardioides sp.]